jgi:hypothetical protein
MDNTTQVDGASVDEIRAHLKDWVDSQGMRDFATMHRMCIVIDEESLQTLLDAPRVGTEKVDGSTPFVKVVEAWALHG